MENITILRYNLQLFAKDGPGGEKTEAATPKKLDDARKDGQVAKSKELVSAVFLLVMFVAIKFTIGTLGEGLINRFTTNYGKMEMFSRTNEVTVNSAVALINDNLLQVLLILAPIFAVAVFVSFIGEIVQVKWQPTTKPLKPKLSKLNPLKGFKNIFSKQSVMNLLKSMAIVVICLISIWNTLSDKVNMLFNLYEVSLISAIEIIGEIVLDLGIQISAIYLIIGFIDFVFQKRKFKEDMKMTKQEVKDEFKNAEGDPQVKNKIRRKMQQVSQRRMMQQLPQADVVITNPTHFAVAIKYDLDIAKAPIVIAKGEDYLAQKIKEVARENKIEIYENKPLARALYQSVDIGGEIPQELYQAVAEVLAFVYNLKK